MEIIDATLIGFVCGFLLIPVSSRLLKSLSWETPFRFRNMLHIIRFPKQKTSPRYSVYKFLLAKMICFCCLYGIVFSMLFAFLFFYMDTVPACFTAAMLVVVALSGLIDLRIWILPDFFTIPMIISGLAVTYYFQPLTNMEDSIAGCVFGYIMPLIVSLILQRKYESPIGGGDVKMMAGLGAWLGLVWFNIMLVLSFVTFAGFAFLRKSNVCPYGPPLTLASLITVAAQVFLNSAGIEPYR